MNTDNSSYYDYDYPYIYPKFKFSYNSNETMEVYHTADDFTILRQANKLGGITVGYSYYRVSKITADEANFYKDSARDMSEGKIT